MNAPAPAENDDRDQKLNAVIVDYLKKRDAGKAVSRRAILNAYPDLVDGLRSYFDGEAMLAGAEFAPTILNPNAARADARDTLPPGMVESDTASEFSPRTFGRYQLLRPLGEGAMGSVFLARDSVLDRQVALKVPKSSGSGNVEFMARFAREAKAAAALKHPNICRVYDAGEFEGTAFITMDFINGVPLSRHIGSGKLRSLDSILRMLRIIADAVGHAHKHGVVHRDLKPGNILVDADLNPHVTDFGLARRAEASDESRLTQEGLLIGTPAYMAPEQVMGEQAKVGPQSDIYSLGVIFFEMMTCRLPFEGSMALMLARSLHDAPPVPGEFRKDLPKGFNVVCLKMLNKLPQHRYQSMSDVIQAIDQLQEEIQQSPVSDPPGAQQCSLFRNQKTLQPMPEPGFLKQWRVLAGLTSLLVFLSLSFYVIFYLKSGTQLIAVHVDDEWLRQQGGEITLQVDGETHTISAKSRTEETLSFGVTLGQHTFSVRHGDTVVHDPRTFEIKKGGRSVVSITATDIRLENSVSGLPTPMTDQSNAGLVVDPTATTPSTAGTPMMAGTNGQNVKTERSPTPTLGKPAKNINEMNYSSQIDGATKQQLIAWADDLPEGLRPHWISVRPTATAPLFDAVASVSPDRGDWSLEFYDTQNPERETAFGNDRFERSLEIFNVYKNPQAYEKLAVWTNGDSLEWWHGSEGFMTEKISEYAIPPAGTDAAPMMLTPLSLRGYEQAFAVVFKWQPYRGVETFLRLSDDELAKKVEEYRMKGWRLHLVDSVRDSALPTSMAVFTDAANSDKWEFSQQLTVDEYHRKLLEVDAQGGRARCVYSRDEDGKILYTAVWDYPAKPQAMPAPIADDDFQAVAPFNSVRAQKYQQACAAHLKLPAEFTNSIGMTFRLIPPGTFTIGCSAEEIATSKQYLYTEYESDRPARCDSEGPQQVVTITKPFYLGITEVTQQQFQIVIGQNPSSYAETGSSQNMVTGMDRSNAPVEDVTWMGTLEFCNRLTEHEKLESAYQITPQLISQTGTGGYRLPTEAEWEFACRAGTTSRFSCGDTALLLQKHGWFVDNNSSELPSEVGKLAPNPFGLYDMHGNVWEWVHDCWRPDTYKSWTGSAAVDPRMDTSSVDRRVIRGGDFFLAEEEARSGCRDCYSHDSCFHDVGFRVALSVDAVRQLLTQKQ
ncbi:MAG TPA: bifunctional serine/threonine-protein kinase/formylglycine-generating enzyme family protein [Planctomycetaceae bacterium]|nr:bifunctional serine/threonine-protein kinase/formylglycine-generating enzyme family protein [Planctomycetaceae bacterium]